MVVGGGSGFGCVYFCGLGVVVWEWLYGFVCVRVVVCERLLVCVCWLIEGGWGAGFSQGSEVVLGLGVCQQLIHTVMSRPQPA